MQRSRSLDNVLIKVVTKQAVPSKNDAVLLPQLSTPPTKPLPLLSTPSPPSASRGPRVAPPVLDLDALRDAADDADDEWLDGDGSTLSLPSPRGQSVLGADRQAASPLEEERQLQSDSESDDSEDEGQILGGNGSFLTPEALDSAPKLPRRALVRVRSQGSTGAGSPGSASGGSGRPRRRKTARRDPIAVASDEPLPEDLLEPCSFSEASASGLDLSSDVSLPRATLVDVIAGAAAKPFGACGTESPESSSLTLGKCSTLAMLLEDEEDDQTSVAESPTWLLLPNAQDGRTGARDFDWQSDVDAAVDRAEIGRFLD